MRLILRGSAHTEAAPSVRWPPPLALRLSMARTLPRGCGGISSVTRERVLVGRVRAAQWAAVLDVLEDLALERFLGGRRLGDLVREVGRDADHALLVADHDVAGVHGDLGAADRDLHV